MKRFLTVLLIAGMMLVLSACAEQDAQRTDTVETTQTDSVIPTETDLPQEPTRSMEKYHIDDLLLVTADRFIFRDPAELDADTVYSFFIHTVFAEQIADPEQWFDGTEYVIPADVFLDVIRTYLGLDFTDRLTETEAYRPDRDALVTDIFGGYGGIVEVNLLEERRDGNTVTLIVERIDPLTEQPESHLEFCIEDHGSTYTFISVARLPEA